MDTFEVHASQPLDATASCWHSNTRLMHKDCEHFGDALSDGAWSSRAIFCPPIGSLLDLREGLRGDADA